MSLLPDQAPAQAASEAAAKLSTAAATAVRARLRVVLVRTSHPGNVGASARALRTMGLERLMLVAPARFPHPDATAMAAGAEGLLAAAGCHGTLAEALAGVHWAVGATARRRGIALPVLGPREAAARLLERALVGEELALVFGNERTGLENEELALCQAAVTIPSDPEFPSLNLAQAVQVLCYELRMAVVGLAKAPTPQEREPPATVEEFEAFMAHLARYLERIDFHKRREPTIILLRLRRLLQRAEPTRRELRILHGILSDSERLLPPRR